MLKEIICIVSSESNFSVIVGCSLLQIKDFHFDCKNREIITVLMCFSCNETAKQYYGRIAVLRKLQITSFEIRKTLAVSTILSCLDYCNSLTANATKKHTEKYQKVVRATVRYVLGLRKFEATTEHRKKLHILDAGQRARYKVVFLN